MAALKHRNSNLQRDIGNRERKTDDPKRDWAQVMSSKSWLIAKPLRAVDALRLRLLSEPASKATGDTRKK